MSDFISLFDTVVVRKDQIVSIKLEDDYMTNFLLNDSSEDKEKFYLLSIKTDCFNCDLVKRYNSKYEAADNFRRISKELGVLFNGECRCEDDPRFKHESRQFVEDWK